jgi:putative copper export protein
MDLRRLRPGEWVLTAAAIVLVVSLFLSWYALPTGRRATAWEAFSVVDAVLLACAAVGMVAVVAQATQRSPAVPVVASAAATWAGVLAVVLILIKVADPPGRYTETCYGIWSGLVGAVGLLAGGWWAIRDDRPGLPWAGRT